MLLRPLTDSVELGAAIAYAKARYEAVAGAVRPNVFASLYEGATDRLLVRIVLALTPEFDVVQILDLTPEPQDYIFITNHWDKVTGTFGPIYFDDPEDTTPHTPSNLVIGDTGTVILVGGASGKPVVMTSANTGVCSVTPFLVTYEDLVAQAPTWTDPSVLDQIDPAMWIGGFTVTLNGYGLTSFSITQAGNGRFLPAPDVYSGPWLFAQGQEGDPNGEFTSTGGACTGGNAVFMFDDDLYADTSGGACTGGSAVFVQEVSVTSSRGACTGGSADSFGSFDFSASGGACTGGEADSFGSFDFSASGGACTGGSADVATLNLVTPKPTVQANPAAALFPFEFSDNRIFTLTATPARAGSTMTFRIVSLGTSCRVNLIGSPVFSGGVWTISAEFFWDGAGGGATSFSFSAIETANGVSAESVASLVTITVQAPVGAPTAASFEIFVPFALRNSIYEHLRGTAARTGSVLVYYLGAPPAGLTPAVTGDVLTTAFSDTWHATYQLTYYVVETMDGISKTSNTATITITIAKPVMPTPSFTVTVPSHSGVGGQPWRIGEAMEFTYTGPSLAADGTPLTLLWAIMTQPGPNMAYLSNTDQLGTSFVPIDAGVYVISATISDQYDQSAAVTTTQTCAQSVEPPTLKLPMQVSAPFVARLYLTLELDGYIERKRDGVLTFQLIGYSENCLIEFDHGLHNGVLSTYLVFGSAATAFPASHWVAFTATETADGVAAVSTLIIGYITIQADTSALSMSFASGTLSWAGGKPPYMLLVAGGLTGTPSGLSSLLGSWTQAKSVTVPVVSGFCDSAPSSAFVVKDSSSPAKTASIAVSACGVPVCTPVSTLSIVPDGYNSYRVTGGSKSYTATITGKTNGISVSSLSYATYWKLFISGSSGCYCTGAGVTVQDSAGASVSATFTAPHITLAICTQGCLDTPPPPPPPSWQYIWQGDCQIAADRLVYMTNAPGGTELTMISPGWGIYTYGDYRIKIAYFGLEAAVGHTFGDVEEFLMLNYGMYSPYSWFNIAAWENYFETLTVSGVEYGALHVAWVMKRI